MNRTLKNFVSLVFVSIIVLGGFAWGRLLGSANAGQHAVIRQYLARLLATGHGQLIADAGTLQDPASMVPPSDVFDTVLDHVQREFVEGVDNNQKLSNGTLGRMFASLNDPRTYYLEPDRRAAEQSARAGRFAGIGAVLAITRSTVSDVVYNHLTVVDVMPGGPAARAGVRSGDIITELNGHWIIAYSPQADLVKIVNSKEDIPTQEAELKKLTDKFKAGYTLSKSEPLLLEGQGKDVAVTVERSGQAAPIKLTMTTALTEVDPVETRALAGGITYVHVRQFNSRATDEFTSALSSVRSGAKGIVLDLRGNPGGVKADSSTGVDGYGSALKLIARLTQGGQFAQIERKPGHKEPLTAKASSAPSNVPLYVLVDHGTANLAELTAAALRDTGKAKIVGEKTFGDSVLQLFAVFHNGGGAELTTAKLFQTNGTELSAGITPDVAVAPGAPGADPILDRALSALGVSA